MHVEVALQPSSAATAEQVRPLIIALFASQVGGGGGVGHLLDGVELDLSSNPQLAAHVKHARVFDVPASGIGPAAASTSFEPIVHVHPLFDEEAAEEDAGDGESVAFQLFTLPSLEFDGLGESLVYDDEVQPRLLLRVDGDGLLSRGRRQRVIAWNRVVLLHPAGHREDVAAPRLLTSSRSGCRRSIVRVTLSRSTPTRSSPSGFPSPARW